ncbi:MAG: efflux RND transporter periplasmic adaptor subunit [Pirellulales bacterium]
MTSTSAAYLRLALYLALGAISAGCNRSVGAPDEDRSTTSSSSVDRVTAGKPQRKTMRLETAQPGQIDAFEETPIHPKVSGYVSTVLVDIGDRVEKDQLLARLSVPELEADLLHAEALVSQAEAGIKKAEAAVRAMEAAAKTAETHIRQAEAAVARTAAQHERWKSEHRRISELAERGSVTNRLVDETLNQLKAAEAAQHEAEAAVDSAKAAFAQSQADTEKAKSEQVAAVAEVEVAKATQAKAKAMLAYTEIKAPFRGVVSQRHVDTGHFTQTTRSTDARPLFVVSQSDTVRVFVDVPELEAAWVDPGDSAIVQVQALRNKQTKAKVTRTSWTLNSSNRALRTEIDVSNERHELRPGMYATVRITLDERPDALVLPGSAVVYADNEAFCHCVDDGKIVRRLLTLGIRSGGEVEVLEGLSGEETVVLLQPASFKPGQSVAVREPAAK